MLSSAADDALGAVLENVAQLRGRAGEEQYRLLADGDVLPRGEPFAVGEYLRAGDDVGFLFRAGGDLVALGGEVLFDGFEQLRIALHRQPEQVGDRFARDVVVGAAESAGRNYEV